MQQKNKNIDWNKRLYLHQPDEDVWRKIEEKLDFESKLSNCLCELPVHYPDLATWEKISSNLHSKKTINFKYLYVAASIAVVIITSTIMVQQFRKDKYITTITQKHSISENDLEEAAIAEIQTYCSTQMPACEKSRFKELMQLYEELKAEEAQLNRAIQQFGDSPEMIQSIVKIENLKSATLQDMIILIQS
jgi:hypothetical protein